MSPEAQRIAIAGACGWRVVDDAPYFRYLSTPDGRRGHSCGKHLTNAEVFRSSFLAHPEVLHVVPDYLTDLNALHEAEKVLTDDQFDERYVVELGKLFYPQGKGPWKWSECPTMVVRATAPQRCEAFLKTIGRWKDA